ncbi:hypothetical protein FD754_024335 [Muntiacus muntjak]|uniref:Uncharacterized protein n=1 Tax=Muntiacus muntjak TaxID=9888 RepID=A0A5N3UPY8_MUNMU|nr:hypothetical protein FD754_024335 [Muntiacus muntjak]
MESGPPPTSVKTKNLFLALIKTIVQTLMVISCFVCGVTKMGEQWPQIPRDPSTAQTSIIGKKCLALWGPIFNILVGRVTCLCQRYYKTITHTSDWWGSTNYTAPNPHPLASYPNLKTRRGDLSTEGHWPAPEVLLCWICGANAYSILPANWSVGTIHLSFFLLPLAQCELLGIPVYKDKKDDKWPPECIILHYGPANWAEVGSWNYQTPIYMHNRIIWLQAVVEIFTNEMVKFLNLLVEQQTKMLNVIYQNHLALDYLLAIGGGNCCLQIDDKGKVIEEITRKMPKIAHVSVQTRKGWNPGELLEGWFSYHGGFKTLV